jgi:hypothetical protein
LAEIGTRKEAEMLWELFQLRGIHGAQADAAAAKATAQRSSEEAQRSVQQLRKDVEWLTLTVAALAEILERRAGVTAAEVEAVMREIDLRDGKADGKVTLTPQPCGACGRPNSSRRDNCLYCSAPLSGPTRFTAPQGQR